MAAMKLSRRRFVSAGVVAASVPYFVPASALGADGKPGANDRIRVGLIGAGLRPRDLMKEAPDELQVVTIADCDLAQPPALMAAMKKLPHSIIDEKATSYQDYRTMFDKEKIDGVFIATTTQARVSACVDAMQAGLDVYAEKPLSLTIDEGRYLVKAEKKFKRIFQTGSQQRSIPINVFGSELVRTGKIGKVHTVLVPNFIGPELLPELPADPCPATLNWDMWCHQTKLIPFSTKLHPGLWRWGRYRDYDGGGLGFGVTGWGTHSLDQVQCALGTDDTGPVEIWPEEPGPQCRVTMKYANGTLIKLELPKGKGPGLGAIFIGDKGKIEINRNRVASNPAELVKDAPAPEDKSELASIAHDHIANWAKCMRTREKPACPAETGHRATVLCHLVNVCREVGRKLKWDPATEKFVGDDEANKLCSRPRRKGYELPEL